MVPASIGGSPGPFEEPLCLFWDRFSWTIFKENPGESPLPTTSHACFTCSEPQFPLLENGQIPPTLRVAGVLVAKRCYPCICFTPWFLNLSTIDILDKISFFVAGCPERCRMFSSTPGLYPLDASIELPDSANTNAGYPGKFEFQINIEKFFSLNLSHGTHLY